MNDFKTRLKALLKARQLNYTDFAKQIGVCKTTVDRYMSCESEPPASKLIAIAKFFDVSVDWLLGLTENIKPTKKSKEQPKAEKKPTENRVAKVVISTPNMSERQLELLVRSYTGLSKEAVRGLHNSRAIPFEWRRGDE